MRDEEESARRERWGSGFLVALEVEQGAGEEDGIGQRGAGGKEMGSWERWIGLAVPWRREETRSGIERLARVSGRIGGPTQEAQVAGGAAGWASIC